MSFSGLFLPCSSFSVTVLFLIIPMFFPSYENSLNSFSGNTLKNRNFS